MSLYLRDANGHLIDVGSASRYEKFCAWAAGSGIAEAATFCEESYTDSPLQLAKALEASGRAGLAQEIAKAARVAIGPIAVEDEGDAGEFRAAWMDTATGIDDHGRDPFASMFAPQMPAATAGAKPYAKYKGHWPGVGHQYDIINGPQHGNTVSETTVKKLGLEIRGAEDAS